MKRIAQRAMIMILTFCFLSVAHSQKIAHLDMDSLLSMMPETKKATEVAQEYLKKLMTQLNEMQNEYQSKHNDYTEKENQMTGPIKGLKEAELQQLQERIQTFQTNAEADYKRKDDELTAPIIKKAKKAIDIVAKEGGYKYVLDTSKERTTVLYSESSDNILMAVKRKLDTMPL
jgi:outer membrane protein